MAHHVYCGNCGTRLPIIRKAAPGYPMVIDVVEYHACPDKPFDIKDILGKPTMAVDPVPSPEGRNKFVRKLDELKPQPVHPEGDTLTDRRPKDQVKDTSSAPASVIERLKALRNLE